MALMNCPECTKEISDKSAVCIHCGYPLEKVPSNAPQRDNVRHPHIQEQTHVGQKQVTSKASWLYAVLGLIVLLVVGTFAWYSYPRVNADPCADALRVFVNEVRTSKKRAEGLRDLMQKYKNKEVTNNDFSVATNDDLVFLEIGSISRAMRLELKTCRTEPYKIVNALKRVYDAQLTAFLEIDAFSREQVLGLLDDHIFIVEVELAQVDALLKVIDVQQAPVEQPAEAPVDACTAAVRVFASDVRTVKNRAEGMRDTMQKYIDNTYTARQLELPVMSAFRELQILETPTCRPEPAQIVSALYRVQDAELLAFIEMSTADAGGSSRATALLELDIQMPIVERELAQVDAWLRAIE